MDDEAGRRRAGRFKKVNGRDPAAVGGGVEREGVTEGKAHEQAQDEREPQGGNEAGQLGREEAHELMGEPQRDEPGEEESDGQPVEPGQPGRRASRRPSRPDQAAQSAPEQPGAEEEAEGELVAVKLGGEFPEEIDLERGGQKAQKERRQPRASSPDPGDGRPA